MVHRVVFQISTGDKEVQQALLRQLGNLLTYYEGRALEVEVVVHGKAYPLLSAGSAAEPALAVLHASGVQWLLCANSIRSLPEDTVWPDFVAIIPAGVGHLVERQMAGWAYLRAGE